MCYKLRSQFSFGQILLPNLLCYLSYVKQVFTLLIKNIFFEVIWGTGIWEEFHFAQT